MRVVSWCTSSLGVPIPVLGILGIQSWYTTTLSLRESPPSTIRTCSYRVVAYQDRIPRIPRPPAGSGPILINRGSRLFAFDDTLAAAAASQNFVLSKAPLVIGPFHFKSNKTSLSSLRQCSDRTIYGVCLAAEALSYLIRMMSAATAAATR